MWQAERQPPPDSRIVSPPGVEESADWESQPTDSTDPTDSARDDSARKPGDVSQPVPMEESVAKAVPATPGVAPWSRVFELPHYRVEVTNRGAGFKSWTLTDARYTERLSTGERPIEIFALQPPYDVALRTPLRELKLGDLSQEFYTVESEDARGVTLALKRGGVTIRKQYRFDPESYDFHLSLSIENGSNQAIEPRFGVEWPAHVSDGQDFKDQSLVALFNGDVEREAVASLGTPGFMGFGGGVPEPFRGDVAWTGVDLKYFLSALITDRVRTATAEFQPIVPGKSALAILAFEPETLPPGSQVTHEFRGYAGPKEPSLLDAAGSDLALSINFGYFWVAPLTRFFGSFLTVIYAAVGNYGLAIIIMTVLVRIVTLPIMQRQMKSMERMRAVQPLLKELQEKYGDDRQKFAEEQMKVFKREGVNPLGGCLPMLLQFPVFIGLFFALQSSIELRHAPFFGYIQDLAAPASLFTIPGIDIPFRLLPVLMGASMVLQQRMTPMTIDPAQARMMMTVMPVMMTVLFYQFPSGLVLYWMVSNLLGIAHQVWVGRQQRAAAA
jgi:YidC/Oxa1 family membrane protein insertase